MSLDPITAGIDLAKNVVNKFFPDAGQAEKDRMVMAMAVMQSQSDINKTEAANPSLLVSGGRPFIIWVCGVGFGVEYVMNPLLTWVTMLFDHPTPVPHIPVDALLALLVPMLGLAGYRTIEKIKGVASK